MKKQLAQGVRFPHKRGKKLARTAGQAERLDVRREAVGRQTHDSGACAPHPLTFFAKKVSKETLKISITNFRKEQDNCEKET